MHRGPLGPRVLNAFARGTLVRTDDGPHMQEMQVRLLSGERLSGVERIEGYGLTTHPPAGSELVVGFVGSERSHPMVLGVGQRGVRPVGGAAGEVALYDGQGQVIRLAAARVEILSPLPVTVQSEQSVLIDVKGTVFKVSDGRIDMGEAPAPLRMMTEAGPSNVIWGVI
ncbi:phage baseplate assembly protein [Amorphus sp. 3PC139-8]|uniref:phage baseplate assembly protein domain-containing protein n=1 Tax=Amorphus sp. 3PC139-8 TaxID=2735676 RepID=UPI00345CFDA7